MPAAVPTSFPSIAQTSRRAVTLSAICFVRHIATSKITIDPIRGSSPLLRVMPCNFYTNALALSAYVLDSVEAALEPHLRLLTQRHPDDDTYDIQQDNAFLKKASTAIQNTNG